MPESVHPFSQPSDLRFDHLGRSNRFIPESPPGFLAPLCRKESQSHRSTRHQIRAGRSFANALWFNSEIEFRFRCKRFRSVELTIEALDLLSQTAARYGRRGRKVFVVNQEAIVNAIRLIECLPLEEAEEVLVQPLTRWLEHPPEFDPEGWALPLFGEFCSSFLSHRSWLEKRREWVSDAKSKKAPAGEPSLAFNHERERSRLSVECSNSSDRNPKPGPYSPESRCAPTLGGPLIKCGEGVGETSGDSIAISWLTVIKR
jgi:hypothetical protein